MIIYDKRIMKEGKCSVCNHPVMVDEIGNGDVCKNCGWVQDSASIKLPHSPSPIIISLDKARQLYKERKPFKPDFEDFIDFYETNGEVEFTYNNIIYGMAGTENDAVQFWACNVPIKERNPIVFVSIDEFIANASIDGVLVKDLWNKVENPGYLQ